MNSKAIIFAEDEVSKILSGEKTQFRRLIEPQPTGMLEWFPKNKKKKPIACSTDKIFAETIVKASPFKVGDLLFLRESYVKFNNLNFSHHLNAATCWKRPFRRFTGFDVIYKADGPLDGSLRATWKSPATMPMDWSRLILMITSVRAHRIRNINESDAQAEGYGQGLYQVDVPGRCAPFRSECYYGGFAQYWNKTHPNSWANNDWVWGYSFSIKYNRCYELL